MPWVGWLSSGETWPITPILQQVAWGHILPWAEELFKVSMVFKIMESNAQVPVEKDWSLW